jgi:predicted PurR-regulated permease PerM
VSLRRQAAFWLAAFLLLVGFLWLFRDILLPFILGMALAYLLDPIADRLERMGMSRLWATITIVLLSVVAFALALILVIPVLAGQLAGFLERLPDYVARLKQLAGAVFQTRLGQYLGAEDARTSVEGLVQQGASWIGTVLLSVWAGGRAIVDVVSLMIVTPVVAFYLLYDWDRMIARMDGLLPRDYVATVRRLAAEIDRAMSGFIRGQGTLCLVLGLFYAVALSLVGLNFGLLIGVVAGLISFIPYVGSIVGFVTAVGVALVQFWPHWHWVVAVAGIFWLGQFLEGNILQPRLVGHSVGVHPVWLMFALFAFGSLFGFVGLLMAVPATAAIGVLVRFGIERYKESAVYRGAADSGPRGAPSSDPPHA